METEEYTFLFVNEENKEKLMKKTIIYLEEDFMERGSPKNHFWYNSESIKSGFDKAMVGLNDREEIVSYMIWEMFDQECGIMIEFVEVVEKYKRKGIFKKMIESLHDRFPDIYFFMAYPATEEGKAVFSNWEHIGDGRFIKILRSTVSPVRELPGEHVIAISGVNFYEFENDREKYRNTLQYFPFELDDDKLKKPIIFFEYHQGYVGIYLNKKLVAEGKINHLFSEGAMSMYKCLIITRFILQDKELQEKFHEEYEIIQRKPPQPR